MADVTALPPPFDLEQLMLFLVDMHPGFRLDIHNWQNTGGWHIELMKAFTNTYESPEDAVIDVFYQLGHTEDEYKRWVQGKP